MNGDAESLRDLLARSHRHLDDLLGQVVGALAAGDAPAATDAIVAFDRALREHTRVEEELLLPERGGARLVPSAFEEAAERLGRELRLEHVQLRELSGMLARVLSAAADLEGAQRLWPNLARRWDAHTAREEREAASGGLVLPAETEDRLRNLFGISRES